MDDSKLDAIRDVLGWALVRMQHFASEADDWRHRVFRMQGIEEELNQHPTYQSAAERYSVELYGRLLAILEEDAAAAQWIPVGERLPEPNSCTWVLTATGKVLLARLISIREDRWFENVETIEPGGEELESVVSWQPVIRPAAPRGDAQGDTND